MTVTEEIELPPTLRESIISRFREHEESYTSPLYKEAEVRREFVEPLFEAIGWDVANRAGYAEGYKDVVAEYSLTVGGSIKAPDYSFRIGGTRRFFVETKRPSIDLRSSKEAAYQLRRYGWSAKLGVSILTNFRQLAVYDCRIQPHQDDSAAVARVAFYDLLEEEDAVIRLQDVFSKEAVLHGSLDEFSAQATKQRGRTEVDDAFLAQLEGWRELLAADIAANNAAVTDAELGGATQLILDRIVFLRICEDRGVEPYGQLRDLSPNRDAYDQLNEIFRFADAKYNSGLFHFRHEASESANPDTFTPSLSISDGLLRRIAEQLYYPMSPYAFAVLSPEILGQIYERFLGTRLRLSDGRTVTTTIKHDVKKSGGVVYTPSRIVALINGITIDPLLSGKSPSDIAGRRQPRRGDPLRIVDPACGSGSFLLEAYDRLLTWYLDQYVLDDPQRRTRGRSPALRIDSTGSYQLTIPERRRILLDHIYGVDIDAAAVEVTKLSLLLKVLERENEETMGQGQLPLERALPDLAANIVAGNSLVAPDFFAQQPLFRETLDNPVNPFDWRAGFPGVFGHGGFDAVIGNPPWLMAGYYLPEEALDYIRRNYSTATGKFDLYYVFIEAGLRLLREGGRFGMIVPNKMFHTSAAASLREMLADLRCVERILDFGIERVFPTTTNYSAILSLSSRPTGEAIQYTRFDRHGQQLKSDVVHVADLSAEPWHFHSESEKEAFGRMEETGVPLGDLVVRFATGVQTGADRILVLSGDDEVVGTLERDAHRPFLKGRDVRRWRADAGDRSVVFPYREDDGAFVLMDRGEVEARPELWGLLGAARSHLEQRRWFGKSATELAGDWYGMMYVEPASSLSRPHLISPALAPSSQFAMGKGDLFATGTAGVVALVLDEAGPDPKYMLGLLNSGLVSSYIAGHSPAYQGGYHKFTKPYLRNVPIVPEATAVTMRLRDDIVGLVDRLIELTAELSMAQLEVRKDALRSQITSIELHLDRLVRRLYGLGLGD